MCQEPQPHIQEWLTQGWILPKAKGQVISLSWPWHQTHMDDVSSLVLGVQGEWKAFDTPNASLWIYNLSNCWPWTVNLRFPDTKLKLSSPRGCENVLRFTFAQRSTLINSPYKPVTATQLEGQLHKSLSCISDDSQISLPVFCPSFAGV